MSRLTKYGLQTIQTFFKEKKWRDTEIYLKFKNKSWDVRSVNSTIKWFENTGNISSKEGISQPITVYMNKSQMKVKTLALSQEDQPGIHNSVWKVAQKKDYSKSSVHRLKKSGYKSVKKLITP